MPLARNRCKHQPNPHELGELIVLPSGENFACMVRNVAILFDFCLFEILFQVCDVHTSGHTAVESGCVSLPTP